MSFPFAQKRNNENHKNLLLKKALIQTFFKSCQRMKLISYFLMAKLLKQRILQIN
jgi:hypothetical protein